MSETERLLMDCRCAAVIAEARGHAEGGTLHGEMVVVRARYLALWAEVWAGMRLLPDVLRQSLLRQVLADLEALA